MSAPKWDAEFEKDERAFAAAHPGGVSATRLAEIDRLRWEVEAIEQIRVERDDLRAAKYGGNREVKTAQAERDAARAELADAHTHSAALQRSCDELRAEMDALKLELEAQENDRCARMDRDEAAMSGRSLSEVLENEERLLVLCNNERLAIAREAELPQPVDRRFELVKAFAQGGAQYPDDANMHKSGAVAVRLADEALAALAGTKAEPKPGDSPWCEACNETNAIIRQVRNALHLKPSADVVDAAARSYATSTRAPERDPLDVAARLLAETCASLDSQEVCALNATNVELRYRGYWRDLHAYHVARRETLEQEKSQ